MSLRSWWHRRQQLKASRYIATHPASALSALRQDPALAVSAVEQAINLSAATGQPQRESLQYPALAQLGMGGRYPLATALPKPTPINLRRFSEYPPARRAINALCNSIVDLPWELVPTDEKLSAKEFPEWPRNMRRRIRALRNCLQLPNHSDTWRTLLESTLEDICVGGYGAVEVEATGDMSRPLWLWPVDGQSVRVNANWSGDPSEPRYTQSLGYAGMSVASYESVKLLDDQLLYIRLNPRSNTPFGLGYLEVAFNAINSYIGAFDFATRRASNATPDYLVFLGENIDIPATRQWEHYWRTMIEGMGKTPIIGGGTNPQVLQLRGGTNRDPLYLQWQQWVVRQIAMAFGLSSLKLGLEQDVNKNTAKTMEQEDWETAAPIAMAFADAFTTQVLWRTLGWDDLKFAWKVRTMDELRQSEILKNRWESNSITADEQRAFWNDPPLPDDRGTHTMLEAVALAEMASQPQEPGAADTATGQVLDPKDMLPEQDPVEDDVPHNGI